MTPPTEAQWAEAVKHLGLAHQLSKSWIRQNPTLEELIITAMYVGLADAAKHHNPSRGKFTTFLAVCIRRRVLRVVKDSNRPIRGPVKPERLGFDPIRDEPEPIREDEVEFWKGMLETLADRERRMVTAWVFDGEYQQVIGDREGYTKQRVNQIIRRSLAQLRADPRVLALAE